MNGPMKPPSKRSRISSFIASGLTANDCFFIQYSVNRHFQQSGNLLVVNVIFFTIIHSCFHPVQAQVGLERLNAGQLLDGCTMDEVRGEFFQYVLDVDSGTARTRNEVSGYREIAIFKDGVTL